MVDLVLFLFGLVGLWLGAELLTRGALDIARKFGLSESFIGFTILALGTDFPEIMVAMTGAFEQRFFGKPTSGIIIGNIIGSNMGQIALVLGIVGMIGVLKFKKKQVVRQGLMLVASTLLFLLLASDGLISRADGIVFLLFYVAYFLFLSRSHKLFKKKLGKRKVKISWASRAMLFFGLFIIAGASHLVITHGVKMAVTLGVSQMIVGIILVGIGTSLPELVVSVNAALKGSNGLSIGNLVGSNIIDILLALGFSSQISSWTIDRRVVEFDLPFLLFTVIVVVLFLLTRGKLERKESFLILGLYIVYVSLKLSGF